MWALPVNNADAMSSPDLSPRLEEFTIEMSDVMLPASALESELFGTHHDSGATVVSASSTDDLTSATLKPRSRKPRKPSKTSAAAIMLSRSPLMSEAAAAMTTQPVPEFLCHLFTMLRDQSYADLISWQVPNSDEPDSVGGGMAGIGKIVVHRPEALQDHVLGKYYRHSKYASFQRQLNYFGFKKRLHHGKKGKLSPCSYIHERLTDDVASLFSLTRRPPAKKRASEADCSASLSSLEDSTSVSTTTKSTKKRRLSAKKADKKAKKNKKDSRRGQHGKQQIVVSSIPIQVQAEECVPPSRKSTTAIKSNRLQLKISASTLMAPQPVSEPTAATASSVLVEKKLASPPVAQPTLIEMLSTSLPPSDVLFNDDVDFDFQGAATWVTNDGESHQHNVDSSLIDLAMLY